MQDRQDNKMPLFTVTADQWEIAHQYLDNAPDGTKLPFSVERKCKNTVHPIKKFADAPKPYQTFTSFMKQNGRILAFQRGELSDGSVNKAKYAIDEAGILYVIKVGDDSEQFNNEATILQDLQISSSLIKRVNHQKKYITMNSLGINLKRYFLDENNQSISDELRLDIAIKLCWQLYRLHAGHASATNTAYAHMDIKPDNITIDKDGNIYLIDFGLAEKNPKEAGLAKTNAHVYVAYCDRQKNQVLSKEQYDVIALKRIIHLPDSFYGGGKRYISNIYRDNDELVSLLSERFLHQHQLNEYINTHAFEDDEPDYTQDKTSALMLTAMLINVKLNLNIDNKQIATDTIVTHAITGAYFSNHASELNTLLLSCSKLKLMAALNASNYLEKYNSYLNDIILIDALERASTLETATALVHLKRAGLMQYSETILHSNELSTVISALGNNLSCQHLLMIINDVSDKMTKALLFLCDHHLKNRCWEVINNAAFAAAIVSVISNNNETLIYLLKLFTDKEMIKIIEDKRLYQAFELLRLASLREDIACCIGKQLIASTDYRDAFLNLERLGFDKYEKKYILEFESKYKAFNILINAGINDKNSLKKLMYVGNERADLIIQLNLLNMHACYQRILTDYIFYIEIERIIKQPFIKEITESMLTTDHAREALDSIYGGIEQFNGFKILYDAKEAFQINDLSQFTNQFETVDFLKKNGYYSYIKWLVANPNIGPSLSHLLQTKESAHQAYFVSSILENLLSNERFIFLKEISQVIDIRSFRGESWWKKIKSALQPSDKVALNKLIYSNQELTDKQILKNIKTTILSTSWSYGFFDQKTTRLIGNVLKDVPQSLENQIDVLYEVSSGRKTHTEGIREIKQKGHEQLQERKNMITPYKHYLFGKSKIDQYYECFETDLSFNRAFVK